MSTQVVHPNDVHVNVTTTPKNETFKKVKKRNLLSNGTTRMNFEHVSISISLIFIVVASSNTKSSRNK